MKSQTRTHQFDIKELRSEKSMVQPEQLLNLAMRTNPFGSWRLDVESKEVWWSTNVFHIHGMTPHDGPVDVETAISAYHPEDAISVSLLIDHAIENKKGFDFILRLFRADGELRFVESVATIEQDASGRVTSVLGIVRDVTEQVSEKHISGTQKLLVNSIIANSPVPICVLDCDMNFLQISPSWLAFHNLGTPHEFDGTSLYKTFPNIPDEWKQEHKRALNGEVIRREPSDFHPDGMPEFKGNGAVFFPWKTASKKIGGLVIMITSNTKSKEETDNTVEHIAELFGRSEQTTLH